MLSELKCVPCYGKGETALSVQEQQEYLRQLNGWQITYTDEQPCLEKIFTFNGYKQAWRFCDQVAGLADQQNHHPTILLEWGKVVVTWWTHSVHGLHTNDFICAAKTDALRDKL